MAARTKTRKRNVKIVKRYQKTVRYDRHVPANDYLKNFRIIRYWVQRNYGLSLAEMEILFRLYSEGLFTRTDFLDAENVYSWDKKRFERLLRDGWIHVWRKASKGEVNKYELTYKAKRLVTSVYKKLNGEDPIPTSPRRNIIFKPNAGFMDRVVANEIREFNEEFRKRRLSDPPKRPDTLRRRS